MKKTWTALRRTAPACALAIALTAGASQAYAADFTAAARPNFFERIISFFVGGEAQAQPVKAVAVVATQPFVYTDLDPADVEGAITKAAQLTGAPETYLTRTAWKESSFNPLAKALTSSATGLFQVVDGTWLELMKRYGDRYGLAAEAAQVEYDGAGKPHIADASERRRILDLRFDARVSALMAAELAAENMRILADGLGRAATEQDLYIAHFIGPANAVKLIRNAELNPHHAAAPLFPAAARANQPIFYAGGAPRSCAAVVQRLALS